MRLTQKSFGRLPNGEEAALYILEAGDLTLSLTNYGGCLVSLLVPDTQGRREDVLLGYDTLDGYICNKCYIGATIGRFGNRIANARFCLGGREYRLFANDHGHSLHGGLVGFGQRLWTGEAYEAKNGVFLRLSRESPDGEEGYPGTLRAIVTYGVTDDNALSADYQARVDAACPVNMTNHAYFNLAGVGTGTILDHEVRIHASSYVEVTETLIPTGTLRPVSGTPFDFTTAKPIRRDLAATGNGYDHCFALDGTAGTLRSAAQVYEPVSGRRMRIATTQPGLQFYTGNFLHGVPGKGGALYGKHAGLCLETQHFPDSPNQPTFPSALFGPTQDYHETTVFSFG
jgi:aldose 1-epimerase